MKPFILFIAVFTVATSCMAQTNCNEDNPLFRFDHSGRLTRIHTLGRSPEFPFLRNMTSPGQVYHTIKRCEKNGMHPHEISRLNDLMVQIGFANGISDLTASCITSRTFRSGTVGNMGSRDFSVTYAKLVGNAHEFKAWKITSGNGCYVYLLAKCGNAFYPQNAEQMACPNVPLNLTTQPQEVTLSTGELNTDKVYVYYHIKNNRHGKKPDACEGIPDDNPSRPLLLNKKEDMKAAPETYKISVSSPDNYVKVCPDRPLDVEANISVEKPTDMSGSTTNKEYKMVSKRAYKTSLRKMRKVKRKEERIAKLTNVQVNR